MEIEEKRMNSTERCAKNKRVMYKLQKMKTVKDTKTSKNQSTFKSFGNENYVRFKTMKSVTSKNHSIMNEDQMNKELEDPNNDYLKEPFENIIRIKHQITSLSVDYDNLKLNKRTDEIEITGLEKKYDKSIEKLYEYKPYLKGLRSLVEEFLKKRDEIQGNDRRQMTLINNINPKQNRKKLFTDQSNILNDKDNTSTPHYPYSSHNSNVATLSITNNNHTNSIVPTISKRKESLESLYNSLGHESYTLILKLFEKYCHFGKTFTNFSMDYSQFCSLFQQNNLNEKVNLTKGDLEVIYNRIKKTTGVNKTVSFEEFLLILDEIAKPHYSWANTINNRLKYFFNQFIVGLPCLKKTIQDKHIERWYYFLETEEFKPVIKKYLHKLFVLYNQYRIGDELLEMNALIQLTKDKKIIPVFLSSKEIISVVIFVKYQKKEYMPTNQFDFVSFVEIISTLAIQAYDKYLSSDTGYQKKKEYVEHTERIDIFLSFLTNTKQ